jgi:hypothetical protein
MRSLSFLLRKMLSEVTPGLQQLNGEPLDESSTDQSVLVFIHHAKALWAQSFSDAHMML